MYDFSAERAAAAATTETASAPTGHGAPSVLLTALELPRWISEYAGSRLVDVLPASDVGGGRPVLVLPGFAADDRMTGRLRAHLRRRGFRVHGWGLGPNIGLTDRLVDGLSTRFEEVHARYETPVAVVGWSFGGLLARRLAHEHPDRISRIVCLGSPWRAEGEHTRATAMFERSRRKHGISDRAVEIVERLRGPVPVPVTAVYSRTDGIVPWRGCRVEERDHPSAENVEVLSSHVGLVSNPLVLRVVVDRLTAPSLAPA